jgi:hypothetical protein
MMENLLTMEEHVGVPNEEGQLDLFGLDRMKLGEGCAALARLDLDRAAAIFNALTLENPDFADAKQGYAMAAAWSDNLWELETRGQRDAAVFLWGKVQTCGFGQWGNGLRNAMIRKLAGLIGVRCGFLCAARSVPRVSLLRDSRL